VKLSERGARGEKEEGEGARVRVGEIKGNPWADKLAMVLMQAQ